MNNKTRVFSNLGLGLFVHYGIYSVLGEGEWIKLARGYSDEGYDELASRFKPKDNFTDELCEFAKANNFKYVVLTTRHHDGFSLYDCSEINTFNSFAYLQRDIVREFVNSCRKYGLVPFLYHTLIDWREEKKYKTFSDYLAYLRKSIDILCSNYGEIGGIWFDGQWKYPNANWEEDKLYGLIREKQPSALIINNAGLSRLGERFSRYIDVVTYERSNICNYDFDNTIDKYAAEMCQALNSHWGYAKSDIDYKATKTILYNYCTCRQFGGNFLLNVGPLEDGSIRPIEREIVSFIGTWSKINQEALFLPKPHKMKLPEQAFSLKNGNNIYVFIKDVPMEIDENAGSYDKNPVEINLGSLKVNNAFWLENGAPIELVNNKFVVPPFPYGKSMLVKVAKIEVE